MNFNDAPILGWRDIAYAMEDCNNMKVGPTFMVTHGMDPDTVEWFAPWVTAIALAAIAEELRV